MLPVLMGAYDRILVPTDGSTQVESAIEHAVEVADVHDASLHGLHVIGTDAFAGVAMETSWGSIDQLLRDDAEEAVERIRDLAAERGVPARTEVVEGKPSREIVSYAESTDCDLVVMGTHGRGGIDRLLLGSVAESVVRASSVPVTTVPVAGADGDDG
jgi:nucleotide-binding universal stress UspA family protein